MTFDFDTPIDRAATDSRKWRKYAGQDIIPLWVADMDFRVAPPILEALHRRVDEGIFGYGLALPTVNEAVVDYCARRYGWTIQPDWIVWLPGLVTGLNIAAGAIGEPGDAILVPTPIYPPFMSAPRNLARETVRVPLAVRADGRYEFDFNALTAALTPRTRQLSLCSPHNPVGRAFTREELLRVAEFAARHDLIVTSDEIHCDLILDDRPHVPFAALSEDAAERSITLMAPSKTYNLPGLGCSFAIIPSRKLREAFRRATNGLVPEINVLGYPACEAAFRHGEPWRQALLGYLRGNRDLIASFVAREIPAVKMTPCDATYLAWLDVSALGQAHPGRFFEEHGLGLADGSQYGAIPGKFVRLNFGCRRALLEEALRRLQHACAAA